MATNDLFISDDGVSELKSAEAVIPGLYNDPVGFATFGVGHLVHRADKWGSFLLEAAAADETWAKSIQKKWPGKSFEVRYLEGQAAFAAKFGDLKANAVVLAKTKIAAKKYGKAFDKLSTADQAAVTSLATAAVDEEAGLLAKSADEVLKVDLLPYESAVRKKITVGLTQSEFDALVSLCFNIGVANFGKSSVVTEINKGKHKAGDADGRTEAIAEIEGAFLKWTKANGVVLPGLVSRRTAEAAAFLADARSKLADRKITESRPVTVNERAGRITPR